MEQIEQALTDIEDDVAKAYREAQERAAQGLPPLQEKDWRNKTENDPPSNPTEAAWLAMSPEERRKRIRALNGGAA